MNNEITVTVEGWVARPPQRLGKDESTWVVFRLGSTPWWRTAQGEIREASTSWFDVKVSQPDLIDNVLLSLKSGDPVIVSGRLSPHTWTDKEGNERASMQIAARTVGHSLRWGTALFKRRTAVALPTASTEPQGDAANPDIPPETPGFDEDQTSPGELELSVEELEAQAFATADAAAEARAAA
ncbi:MAG: single-stranded DNA-binding protein [Bifidobacteriaceae bacterium]|jgi:single-strand DNA-binding protein|nr:single-stranded DNA-binding protein [Bifidobacteriaceae bacterium]